VEATGQARFLLGDKKKPGLGPVSMALAEMQLHRSRRPLALEISAARDASASASRASKSQKEQVQNAYRESKYWANVKLCAIDSITPTKYRKTSHCYAAWTGSTAQFQGIGTEVLQSIAQCFAASLYHGRHK
jgi:hypothetical protein